jgi:hypothetical protein
MKVAPGQLGCLTEQRFDELQHEVSEFLGVFRDDDLEHAFGNGYRVTITRDGITKEEYYD